MRAHGCDVRVEIGLRALVPERMVEQARGLPKAVAVLGQADMADPGLTRPVGVQRHARGGQLRRAEGGAVGREMQVVVDEQS